MSSYFEQIIARCVATYSVKSKNLQKWQDIERGQALKQ